MPMEVRRTRGLELRMRVGLHSGEVVVRLTASTLGLVEGLVRVTALGPIPIKGLVEPMAVFELTGAPPCGAACRLPWCGG